MRSAVTVVLCLFFVSPLAAQDVIHYWSFNSSPSNPWPSPVAADVGSGELTHSLDASRLQDFGGTSLNAYDGAPSGGSFSVQVGSDGLHNGESFYFNVPTTGYEAVTLSYATRGTSTGFTTQDIAVSTDGTNFQHVETITGRSTTSWSVQTVDLSGVAGAGDNEDLQIRITLDGGTSTFGNNRFDNVRVSGTPSGANLPPFFTSELSDQDVTSGELFEFTYEASDPDGDSVSLSLIEGPSAATFDPQTGDFSWTPGEIDEGQTFTVTVEATDGELTAQTSAELTVTEPLVGEPATDLFISEYVEGSSFNKALEIYNPTSGAVDLTPYAVEIYFNGGMSAGSTIDLSGTLASGETYVIAHTSADVAALADLQSGSLSFNGDDAVTLSNDGSVVDAIGEIGVETVWGSGDTTTQNNTLRRLSDACTGRTDPFTSYAPADYFEGYPEDTFDGIGSHAASCEALPENDPPAFVATLSSQLTGEGETLSFQYEADDPDGDAVTFFMDDAPEGATLDSQTGQFSWTTSDPGVYGVEIWASDGSDSTLAISAIAVEGAVCEGLEAEALRACLRSDYSPDQTLGYTPARDLMYTDIDLEADNKVRGIYTDFAVALEGEGNPRQIMGQGGINAEHVWPQSRGAGDEPQRSDMHHLFPARDVVNSSRGNLPLVDVPLDAAETWWRLDERLDTPPEEEIETYSRRGPGIFEPRDAAKGATARAMLYFFAMYEADAERDFMLRQKADHTAWTEDLRPEGWEIRRTYEISKAQGNVNPFVIDQTLAARMLTDVTAPPAVAIAEARAEEDGTTVTIEGIVTRSGGRFARLQDETAGLTVFESGGAFRSAVESGHVAPGDEIRIVGAMDTFNNLRQIQPSIFEVLSRDNELPEPVELTLEEIAANPYTYQSQLIRVPNLDLREPETETFEAATTYEVQDASADFGEVNLRTPAEGEGGVIGTDMPEGRFTFVGVPGHFLDEPQLQPIEAGDIVTPPVIIAEDEPIEIWPPEQQMVSFPVADLFTEAYDEEDGELGEADVFIHRVTSNEEGNGIREIVAVTETCDAVNLRADRDGQGEGRLYTVELGAYDSHGTLGTASVEFFVPHDQGEYPEIDDPVVAAELLPDCSERAFLAGGESNLGIEPVPEEFSLEQSYPNPTTSRATIEYALAEDAPVRITLYNLLGERVVILVDEEQRAGFHSIEVDTGLLASGVYIYHMQAGAFSETGRMTVVR